MPKTPLYGVTLDRVTVGPGETTLHAGVLQHREITSIAAGQAEYARRLVNLRPAEQLQQRGKDRLQPGKRDGQQPAVEQWKEEWQSLVVGIRLQCRCRVDAFVDDEIEQRRDQVDPLSKQLHLLDNDPRYAWTARKLGEWTPPVCRGRGQPDNSWS